MSKTLIGLGALVLGGFGLSYWYKGRAASRLTFSVGVPQNISVSGDGIKFTLPINTTNSDDVKITLQNGAVKNYLGTNQLGSAYLPQSVTIGAKSTTAIMANFAISYSEILTSLGSLWTGIKALSLSMRAAGYFEAEYITFDFDLPYTLKNPI
jgi:hypothetical protein